MDKPTSSSAANTSNENEMLEDSIATRGELNESLHKEALKAPLIDPPDKSDLESIRAASVSGMEGGEAHVRKVHEDLHDQKCSGAERQFTEHSNHLKNFIDLTENMVTRIRQKLASTDRHLAVPAGKLPWNRFDKIKLFFYSMLSLAALIVGINQLRIILMASGYFESNLDAVLFSLLPLGIAAVMESLESYMPTDFCRTIYVRSIHIIALLVGSIWIWLLILQYASGLTEAVAFDTNSFTDFGDSQDPIGDNDNWVGIWLLRASVAGEIFVSASMWLAISSLVQRHAPFRPIDNPEHVKYGELLIAIIEKLLIAKDLHGQFNDRLENLKRGRNLYVAAALNQYHLAKSARENTALLSEHLIEKPIPQLESSNSTINNNGKASMSRLPLALLFTFIFAFAAHAQTTYVVGIPNATTEVSAKQIMSAAISLTQKAEVGDKIEIVDASGLIPLASYVIPTGNARRRMMSLRPHIARVHAHIKRSINAPSKSPNYIRFPQFTALAARSMGQTPNTRILVFGRANYNSPKDPMFSFGGETYPGDGFLRASIQSSIYGIAEKQDLLKNIAVHYCWLKDDWASELANTAVKRMWTLFLKQQGATLASWSSSEETIISDALKEKVLPVMTGVKLNPKDTGLVMRNIARPLPPEPPSLHFTFIQDGSISTKKDLALLREYILKAVTEASKHPYPIYVSIIVYRKSNSSDIFPKTDVTLPEGYKRLNRFITGKEVEVNIADFREGSEDGVSTGKTMKVARMESLGSTVDIIYGIESGLKELGLPNDMTTPIIMLCGDVSARERSKDQVANKQAERSVLERLRNFCGVYPKTKILSVFSSEDKQSAQFFRAFAEASPNRGTYTTRMSSASLWIAKVIHEHAKKP